MDKFRKELLAAGYATFYHGSINQRRKYTNEPYIVHPEAVVKLVRSVPHTTDMLCAAWLHDTVEDTPASLIEIRDMFGIDVWQYVSYLTNISRPGDGDRSFRTAIDRDHIAAAPPAVKTIKLADRIDNITSVVNHDTEFAKTYMNETRLLLEVLTEGDPVLYWRATKIVDDYYLRQSNGQPGVSHVYNRL